MNVAYLLIKSLKTSIHLSAIVQHKCRSGPENGGEGESCSSGPISGVDGTSCSSGKESGRSFRRGPENIGISSQF